MSKPRVLLDVDGVMADFITPFLALANGRAGFVGRYVHDDVTTWDVADSLAYDRVLISAIYDQVKLPGWCRRMPAYAGAKEGLHLLMTHADVFFVTSPMPGSMTWAGERKEWLKEVMGVKDIGDRYVSTNAKHVVAGDIFVDDKPDHVNKWKRHHPRKISLLWNHNTNQNYVWERVYGWDDLVRRVEEETMYMGAYRGE